jgi:hypothetical protein
VAKQAAANAVQSIREFEWRPYWYAYERWFIAQGTKLEKWWKDFNKPKEDL